MAGIQLDNSQWLTIFIASIGIIAPILTIAANIFEKSLAKRMENQEIRYKRYHQLIEDLVSNKKTYIGCQIAEIYELRKFRENRFSTKKVLEDFYTSVINNSESKSEKPNDALVKALRINIKNVSKPYPIFWKYIDKE
jgi:hypothetical protein